MVNEALRRQKILGTAQTLILAALMIGVAFFVGRQLFGSFGILVAVAAALFVLYVSARPALPGVLARVPEVDRFSAPELTSIVTMLSRRAGLSAYPHIHLVPSGMLNAITFGTRDEAHLVVTYPLLESLTPRELSAVVAHEIAHIRNGDLQLFRYVDILRRTTQFMSRLGWLVLLVTIPLLFVSYSLVPLTLALVLIAAPILSLLLQLALFRTREFEADRTAAELTSDPRGLAQALYRVDHPHPGLFRLLFPLTQRGESPLFRTHPETEERIRRLLSLSSSQSAGRLPIGSFRVNR
jgi:heat shock protein HtpX